MLEKALAKSGCNSGHVFDAYEWEVDLLLKFLMCMNESELLLTMCKLGMMFLVC